MAMAADAAASSPTVSTFAPLAPSPAVSPLNGLVETMLGVAPDIHVLRDPTRGGLTASLCEIANGLPRIC
jgi:hypothetical protein